MTTNGDGTRNNDRATELVLVSYAAIDRGDWARCWRYSAATSSTTSTWDERNRPRGVRRFRRGRVAPFDVAGKARA